MTEENDEYAHRLQPINRFRDMNVLKNFEVIQKLGQGTFGVVQKARNLKTGNIVALKQLLNHSVKEGFPITAMREITIVKSLNHDNVLKILEMIYDEPKVSNPREFIHSRGCFYTVSSYMSCDLVGLLENPNVTLQMGEIKGLMVQLLLGIQYIHEQHYLHRDIKAANILIDSHGVLKIADFGLARKYHGKPPKLAAGPGGGERAYTGLVVTRWYRPPEILLGEKKYTTAVDMWGIGCVFGELFTRKPIMAGKTDSHQCQLVFQLVGPPDRVSWSDAYELPNKTDFEIGKTCRRTLEQRFEPLMHDKQAVDLLSGLLTLDPYARLNALDALAHPFFNHEPLPLKPQELPKYEECHEIDKEKFKKMQQTRPARPTPPPVHMRKVDTYIPSKRKTETPPPTVSYKPIKRELLYKDIRQANAKAAQAHGASDHRNNEVNSGSHIFMPKRKMAPESPNGIKKKKLRTDAKSESDLTDFEEDVNDKLALHRPETSNEAR